MIHINRETSRGMFPTLCRSRLKAFMQALMQAAGKADATLELLLVDDLQIARFNEEYYGLCGPTNILSFPARQPGGGEEAIPQELREEFQDEESDEDFFEAEGDGLQPIKLIDENLLGSIVVSLETLAREAFLYGCDPFEYAQRLLVHSFVHLLGHEHGPEMEALGVKLQTAAGEAGLKGSG